MKKLISDIRPGDVLAREFGLAKVAKVGPVDPRLAEILGPGLESVRLEDVNGFSINLPERQIVAVEIPAPQVEAQIILAGVDFSGLPAAEVFAHIKGVIAER